MATIEQLHERLKKSHAEPTGQAVAVPLPLQSYLLAGRAEEYIGAASVLDQARPRYLLPMLQLTGHAIECTFKACLAIAELTPPNSHSLVELCSMAVKAGFRLEDRDLAMLVHLHHLYYEDLTTGTRFKARYPTRTVESLGGSIPDHSTFVSIIRSLHVQIADRTEGAMREQFNSLLFVRESTHANEA